MKVDLDPARCAGDHLSPVIHPPALDEAHPDGAHAGEAVDSLEPAVDRLRQALGEVLVVEDVHVAAGGYLADGGRVPVATHVAVGRLDEDAALAEVLRENLAADVHESHSASYVTPGQLYGRVAVDVGEQS